MNKKDFMMMKMVLVKSTEDNGKVEYVASATGARKIRMHQGSVEARHASTSGLFYWFGHKTRGKSRFEEPTGGFGGFLDWALKSEADSLQTGVREMEGT